MPVSIGLLENRLQQLRHAIPQELLRAHAKIPFIDAVKQRVKEHKALAFFIKWMNQGVNRIVHLAF